MEHDAPESLQQCLKRFEERANQDGWNLTPSSMEKKINGKVGFALISRRSIDRWFKGDPGIEKVEHVAAMAWALRLQSWEEVNELVAASGHGPRYEAPDHEHLGDALKIFEALETRISEHQIALPSVDKTHTSDPDGERSGSQGEVIATGGQIEFTIDSSGTRVTVEGGQGRVSGGATGTPIAGDANAKRAPDQAASELTATGGRVTEGRSPNLDDPDNPQPPEKKKGSLSRRMKMTRDPATVAGTPL